MNVSDKIGSYVREPLPSFKMLQLIIAIVCMTIPLVLRWTDKDKFYPPDINPTSISNIQNCTTTVRIDSAPRSCCGKEVLVPHLKICESGASIIALEEVWKDGCGFRFSISNYARSSRSYLFGLLYCLAAVLFLLNGVVYYKNKNEDKESLNLDKRGHWYNLAIGLSLLGVVFSPQCELPIPHNIFTGLFFAGNLYALFFASNPNESRVYKIIRKVMAVLILIAVAIAVILIYIPGDDKFTVLYAEWISLTFIGIHLIMTILATNKK